VEKMKDNSEPERDPAVETDDARESVRDVGHTIMFASTGAGKSVSIAELLRTGDKFFLAVQKHDK
jgi:uridine phosphorylase